MEEFYLNQNDDKLLSLKFSSYILNIYINIYFQI